jgi:hypothetical protein
MIQILFFEKWRMMNRPERLSTKMIAVRRTAAAYALFLTST